MTVNWQKVERNPNRSQKIEGNELLKLRSQLNNLVKKIIAINKNLDHPTIDSEYVSNLEEDNRRFLSNLPVDWNMAEEKPKKTQKIENRFLLNISSQIYELKRLLGSL
ncbi:MAG: hypothetical protein ACTSR8_03680 [Promethearchaeota archaeon]